ncbi:hypothetical protein BD779DRAFT_1796716 [Infundibulicybe gibba]|nr:hypothetical protein BD779DRAFT_1796716 [Infundibulicybe gibba]
MPTHYTASVSPSSSWGTPPSPQSSTLPSPTWHRHASSEDKRGFSPNAPYIPTVPLPPADSMHPVLEYNPAGRPRLTFDVSLPPQHITFAPHPRAPPVSPADPAHYPPTQRLVLALPRWLPKEWAHALNCPAGVTLGVVLAGVHALLRTPVCAAEFAGFARAAQEGAAEAFRARAARAGGAGHGRELEGGVRRVDFLGARTRFVGLVRTRVPGVWEVCLAAPPSC